ncbi:CDP-alcohol phosphatidyltransferase family protein [Thermosulfurimonas marina]|uniref:CDP-alcohol phosphatidyltransferase family protein n=1 Tax=Thermosulfurimonas marina TaxID=2047767 RepID=A0A6H1WS85_9BACT|nr:CDP-alcohol phosphatidyltransferase family protein [Thermosulfurimonas marina]QJA06041.1 CDP-alcohol phosphatidyltransferase family protein [Thermosulfurimonas marina]
MTFTERVKARSEPLLLPLARLLARLRVSPNAVSVAGFLGVALAGGFIALGHLRLGGLLLGIFGSLDAVDGLLARRTGQVSTFGAFLDSTLDRYAEIVLFLGILWYLLVWEDPLGVVLAFVALTGSLMVSYARARAEGLGLSCKVGLLTRFERLLLLTLGLLLGLLIPVLAVLAVLTHFTTLQRILHVRRAAHP